MIEQPSSPYEPQKKQSHVEQQNPRRVANKQLPFNKSNTIGFMKIGVCHMCRSKNKVVYGSYRNYQSTSCQKRFCYDCLTLIFKQNIIQIIQTQDSWKSPYTRKVCRCRACCLARKQPYSILQMDPTFSVYANLRNRSKQNEQQQQGEQESMRCLLKEKFKKLIDFNGHLINKVNSNYHKLNQEEIKFYNHLIHSNLTVLNNFGESQVVHRSLIVEE